MHLTSTVDFVQALAAASVLAPDQVQEVLRIHDRYPEPRALARELLDRDWLTPYQANQIFQGHGKDLLLGPYLLLERIGEGSMGKVFKARHLILGHLAAVKVIRKDRLDTPQVLRRFRREIRAAARLSHRNAVQFFEADVTPGRQPYIAMEYVDGIDLARRVRQSGPLPVPLACECVRQAALCLQHAHERGLVHRDIKPSNLLLTKDEKHVKVLDLGLVHMLLDEEKGSQLTLEGRVVGTPDFIAPEQARDSHAVDVRSDLYSLGCTFFYILTGRIPFPGKGVLDKLLQHQKEAPPLVITLRPDVPSAVSRIVRRLMSKRPDDRPQTPAELVRDLQAVLDSPSLLRRAAP